MVTAMIRVHLPYGFSSIKLKALSASGAEFGPPGYELNLVYIAALITLALAGSSALSVDRLLERRKRGSPRDGHRSADSAAHSR
jgi:putative oxidoreductase